MNVYRINIIRFLLLILTQILIFNFFSIEWFTIPFIEIYIYPLVILLLPLKTPRSALIISGFIIGIIVDIFNNTPGIHSGAGTLIGYIRPFIIQFIQPRGGYKVNISPTIVSINFKWFAIYAGIMTFFHSLTVSIFDIFQLKFLHYILLRTFLSGLASYLIVMVIMIIFNPKE
ncbi:hypothetical protein GCM10025777_07170 [Membranihabitans marinus]